MTRVARYNKVLYVEPKYYLKNIRQKLNQKKLKWIDIKNDVKKDRITNFNRNLYIFHSPMFIPFSERIFFDQLTKFLWIKFLNKKLKELNIKNPIVWLSRPEMLDIAGKFNEKLLVYHVVDEYSSYNDVNSYEKNRIQNLEKKLLKKADLVIVVSSNLYKTKKQFNPHTYLVPNAVDFDAYNSKNLGHNKPPKDILKIAKPIIGYSGLVAKRLDFKIINYIAENNPYWSIVFVGKVNPDEHITKLNKLKNIHFLGNKEIAQVPQYINYFDVCIIPYKNNEQSKNISPLKLYDYFATGKPIVSTNFPEVFKFNDIVRIASNKVGFALEIENALSENDQMLSVKRQLIANKNTWNDRIIQISDLINSFLNNK
jgi:hypothetical protein